MCVRTVEDQEVILLQGCIVKRVLPPSSNHSQIITAPSTTFTASYRAPYTSFSRTDEGVDWRIDWAGWILLG